MDHLEASASRTTQEIIRHLWVRRYLILFLPPAILVLSYLCIRFFAGETYVASSFLYVRDRTSGLKNRYQQGFAKIEPPDYEDLLYGDELLKDVINEVRAQFPDDFPQDKFERLKRRFEIEVTATHDTTVMTTYSPVIKLKAEGESPEIAFMLATRWMELSIERYGTIIYDEAQSYVDAVWAEAQKLTEHILLLTREESGLKHGVFELEAELSALSRILTADTGVRVREREHRDDMVDSSSARVKTDTNIRLYGGGQSEKLYENYPLGLLEESVRLRLELAAAQAAKLPTVPSIEARIGAVETLVQETRTGISAVREQLADKEARLARIQAELNTAHAGMMGIDRTMNFATSDKALVADPANPDNKGNLRIISRPTMPENRIKPARTLIAAAVTAALSILLLFLLIAEHQLKVAIREN